MMFKSTRKFVPDRDLILKMLSKPRTTEEVAERLKMPVQSTGQVLAVMASQGEIKRAERRWGMQIWEPIK